MCRPADRRGVDAGPLPEDDGKPAVSKGEISDQKRLVLVKHNLGAYL